VAQRIHRISMNAPAISKSLASKKLVRSERVDPKNRNNQRVTKGYQVSTLSDGNVRLEHNLGDRHGIVKSAERNEEVLSHLNQYMEALGGRCRLDLVGNDEYAYVLVREMPDPAVSETLRKAADHLFKLGDKKNAANLNRWASLHDAGEDW